MRSLRFSTNLQKTELRLSATERVVHACVCVCVCARRRASAATSRILSGRNLRKACRKSTDWHRTRVSCDSNIGRRMRHDAQAFPSVNPFVNLLFVRWNLYRPPLPPFLSLSLTNSLGQLHDHQTSSFTLEYSRSLQFSLLGVIDRTGENEFYRACSCASCPDKWQGNAFAPSNPVCLSCVPGRRGEPECPCSCALRK